ncbi:hypothetical protein [Nocardia sp. CDC160]|uniref:hypothetical protein n=1 Tax=Nocardia sp. CDC160 TaxID=3112166 RepID=UPI002DB976BE|nr:hypothetical protein [Nocardia sp. CDC160]MEC3913324.1 hypothetical protein [Nocardia sp. CDC160]
MTNTQEPSAEATAPDFDGMAPVIGVEDPETAAAAADSDPDIGFSMVAPELDIPARARQLAHRIAQQVRDLGPEGWVRVRAAFALTTTGQRVRLAFSDAGERQALVSPTPELLTLVREHRQLSAELGDPWWRLELALTVEGELTVDHDYGDEPFPADQLFPPADYLADLAAHPREELPTWLAAYLRHDDRQSRTPLRAAAEARADRESGYLPVVSEHDFPDFPRLWSRWAAIAAAFVAVGSEWGPRVLPSFAWFEGSRRSGSSLYMLPGGRAVLSGGVWGAKELADAYNGAADFPRLYAGAPEWVASPVLNTRASGGMLTFCYWWERGRWYRGESPAATELAAAVPGIWTAATTAGVITDLITADPSDEQRSAVAEFVAAAERRDVTQAVLEAAFGSGDLDSAHYQLAMAGVARLGPEPLPELEALDAVRHHVRTEGIDTAAYPLDRLRAERLPVGWMVYVPAEAEEPTIDRALYYVADDGVVEATTSSMPASVYLPGLERRFRQRHSQ